ncbi:hypothetical protein HK102_008181 [Quaeritorhiza haematococci]|nr:hypothetical protein HK102_008181 [Quaeritorhiza haematococci]
MPSARSRAHLTERNKEASKHTPSPRSRSKGKAVARPTPPLTVINPDTIIHPTKENQPTPAATTSATLTTSQSLPTVEPSKPNLILSGFHHRPDHRAGSDILSAAIPPTVISPTILPIAPLKGNLQIIQPTASSTIQMTQNPPPLPIVEPNTPHFNNNTGYRAEYDARLEGVRSLSVLPQNPWMVDFKTNAHPPSIAHNNQPTAFVSRGGTSNDTASGGHSKDDDEEDCDVLDLTGDDDPPVSAARGLSSSAMSITSKAVGNDLKASSPSINQRLAVPTMKHKLSIPGTSPMPPPFAQQPGVMVHPYGLPAQPPYPLPGSLPTIGPAYHSQTFLQVQPNHMVLTNSQPFMGFAPNLPAHVPTNAVPAYQRTDNLGAVVVAAPEHRMDSLQRRNQEEKESKTISLFSVPQIFKAPAQVHVETRATPMATTSSSSSVSLNTPDSSSTSSSSSSDSSLEPTIAGHMMDVFTALETAASQCIYQTSGTDQPCGICPSCMGGSSSGTEVAPAELEDLMECIPVDETPDERNLRLVQELKAKLGNDGTPPGLTCTLMEHQIHGVAWMSYMESDQGSNGEKKLRGGILADDMGFGKTIQSLALIILNRPPPDAPRRTTLIVAPMSLIYQWEREIHEKTHPGLLKVKVHYGQNRTKSKTELRQYDVVITTYQIVKNERGRLPVFSTDGNCVDPGVKPGALFRVKWFRIILDEAHNIKNRNTAISRACSELEAERRFCLTGTPIQNNVDELYSLFRFLELPVWNEYAHFNNQITKLIKPRNSRTWNVRSHKTAIKRLQAVLQGCLLRRTKQSKGPDGRPLITLPERKVELVTCDFTPAERAFYDAVERDAGFRFSTLLKKNDGDVRRCYMNILALLVRLRLAVNHPHLVPSYDRLTPMASLLAGGESEISSSAAVGTEDNDGLEEEPFAVRELRRAQELFPVEVVERMLRLGAADGPNNSGSEAAEGGESLLGSECPLCLDVADNPLVTSCGHVFCKECLTSLFAHQSRMDEDNDDQDAEKPCPYCRTEIRLSSSVSAEAFLPQASHSEPEPETQESVGEETPAETPEITQEILEEMLFNFNNASGSGTFVSSTKINKMLQILQATRQEDPKTKTLFADLLEPALLKANFKYCRYDGKMSARARADAVDHFSNDDRVTVMLVSLKCGGVGLNLTKANRVIMMDFWWNPALEDQAIDRVHRIGQQKPVHVHRLSIGSTVEDRILVLQEQKREVAAGALGEGDIKLGRLSLRELIFLFRHDGT